MLCHKSTLAYPYSVQQQNGLYRVREMKSSIEVAGEEVRVQVHSLEERALEGVRPTRVLLNLKRTHEYRNLPFRKEHSFLFHKIEIFP